MKLTIEGWTGCIVSCAIIALVARRFTTLGEVFQVLDGEARSLELVVNEKKTHFMKMTAAQIRREPQN